jgi:RimJ/RimL family protein N-acetyltransferase
MEGRYCRLEALDPDRHARQLFALHADDAPSWTYMAYGPFADLATYTAWMKSTCLGHDPLFYAIVDLKRNEPVGVASYLRIDPAKGTIEVGHLHFTALLRQTPAATEAMFLMMQRAFDLGYRRYEWKCDSLNEPSHRAALRLGFTFEGVFRNAVVYKERSRDTAWHAILDSEWPALKTAFERWLDPSNFDPQGRQKESLSKLTEPIRGRKTMSDS